jgi:hypothetical protein
MARDTGEDPRFVFDPAGLLLERDSAPWTYFCSPRNAPAFASTGGDGVHFGLLQLDGSGPDDAPVVMTVPMSDTHTIVLAESMDEFLGLGSRLGWFLLEQLAYDPDWAVEHYARSDPDSPECAAILKRMRTALRLKPVALRPDRLTQLRERYLPLVEFPDRV